MKLHRSILLVFSLLFVIRQGTSINFDLFNLEIKMCFKDDTYWNLIDQFFDPLVIMDVRHITEPNSTEHNSPRVDTFLRKLMISKCSMKILSKMIKLIKKVLQFLHKIQDCSANYHIQ